MYSRGGPKLGPCLARVRRMQKAAAKDARFGAHFTQIVTFSAAAEEMKRGKVVALWSLLVHAPATRWPHTGGTASLASASLSPTRYQGIGVPPLSLRDFMRTFCTTYFALFDAVVKKSQ